MVRDKAVDVLMGRLGKRVSTVTQQDIINEMVVVQDTVLEGDATPFWFLLTEQATAQTTPGDERLKQPPDFLQEWEEGALYYIDDSGQEQAFVKDDWEVIKKRITGSGRPEYYALAGEYFLLRKVPDDYYTVKMRYYARQASLAGSYGDASNTENGWLKWAADLVIAETGIVIARQYLQSEKMEQLFQTQAARARARLIAKDTAMREANVQRFMEG